jgi:hypothetical protein
MGDMRWRICFLFREKAEQFVKREKTGKFTLQENMDFLANFENR